MPHHHHLRTSLEDRSGGFDEGKQNASIKPNSGLLYS